jgi:6-pyruvoyltetrahydropterin/6-carboxytetrahydropterin synthase
MFELSVDSHFAAAHCLREYDGDCGRLHGHTWGITVTVGAGDNPDLGMSIDFKTIAGHLEMIVSEFDHRTLNDLPEFSTDNPTAENIARYIFRRISATLDTDRVRVLSVTVSESARYRVTYRPEDA